VLAIGCAFFLSFGFLLVLVGSNQAELARALGIDLSQTGLLVSCLSVGLGIGIISGGRFAEHRSRRAIFVSFSLLLGMSLIGVQEQMSYARVIGHILLAGVGAGTCMTFVNTLASERYGLRAAKALAILHASVTLGAIFGPLGIHWLNEHTTWTMSFRLTGLLALGIGVYASFAPMPAHSTTSAGASTTTFRALLCQLELLLLALVGFSYVGIESSIITFAIPYATQVLSEPTLQGQTAISMYWVGVLTSRFGLLTLGEHTNRMAIRTSGILGTIAMLCGIAFHPQSVVLSTLIMGLALGSLYPVLIAHTGERFSSTRAASIAVISGSGSLGGFTIPWATGWIGDHHGMAMAAASLLLWIMLLALGAIFGCRQRKLEQ